MERMGFEKKAGWVEYKIEVPKEVPERYHRLGEVVKHKYGLRVLRFKNINEIVKQGYALKLFNLLNVAYADLYGFSKLTDEMIRYYVRKYVPLLRLELITLIVDESGELAAFGVALLSLSRAMQKTSGRMLPFGFYHLLRTLHSSRAEVCDFLLVALRPVIHNAGVVAFVFTSMMPHFP